MKNSQISFFNLKSKSCHFAVTPRNAWEHMSTGNLARWLPFLTLCAALLFACKSEQPRDTQIPAEPVIRKNVTVPPFNRDSAYAFVFKQLQFGPRVPNSEGHQKCRTWIITKMQNYGGAVIQQDFSPVTYTGETLNATNIIARFNPDIQKRVILAAHYDTRFMAEEDPDPARRDAPIMGADDGASGVAILVEIARTLTQHPIDLGIDMLFFDAEDQGKRGEGGQETWCLGAQHWGKNPHLEGYEAEFGILLDMVGANGATFQKEDVRGMYPRASEVDALYKKVWNLGRSMGYTDFFIDRQAGGIIDDHYYVNILTGIPMIDIIHKSTTSSTGFGAHWHTHADSFPVISKRTLGAVGQVVLAAIYKESGNMF